MWRETQIRRPGESISCLSAMAWKRLVYGWKGRSPSIGRRWPAPTAMPRRRNTGFCSSALWRISKGGSSLRGSPPDIITLWIESFEGQLTDSLLTETASQSNASNGRTRVERSAQPELLLLGRIQTVASLADRQSDWAGFEIGNTVFPGHAANPGLNPQSALRV